MLKKDRKPSVLITGASGFIGKHLIDALKDRFEIIALARRSGTEAGVPFHPNIRWIQWNIANTFTFNDVMGYLIGRGGADVVVHLAGFYDYEYDNNPEYEKTNIRGTKNVLELARQLDTRHFIFASSLAACKFPPKGEAVNEETPADANFAYAQSKYKGEMFCKEYSRYFTSSVVRLAAVFSDWCEYGPLYQFIRSWLSGKLDARVLGGKGQSAITYIHICDVVRLIGSLIDNTETMPDYGVYIASPDGCTTHQELYTTITRDYYGHAKRYICVPRILAWPGLIAKRMLGRLQVVSPPFEKFWMLQYIDRQLHVDATKTRQLLDYSPTPRYHILRRMIYLLNNKKSHPNEWNLKNEAATKRKTNRPSYMIYFCLVTYEGELLDQIEQTFQEDEYKRRIKNYLALDQKSFRIALSTLYSLLLASIRSADRTIMQQYIEGIALKRFNQGFDLEEVLCALQLFGDCIIEYLSGLEELKGLKQEIYDSIGLTMQLAMDEMEDIYESLRQREPTEKIVPLTRKEEKERLKEIESLRAFYQEYREK
jgi:nucleoside-diphosphate-sugar epimerase